MGSSKYCIGLDFGTNTARALIVDAQNGQEAAGSVAPYPSGEAGIVTDPADPLLARQEPLDYEKSLVAALRGALQNLEQSKGPEALEKIIGIGITNQCTGAGVS